MMKLNNEYVEKILVEFLRNETSRIGLNKAVIGLSGGIDSTVSTYLSVKAFGLENVKVLLMPYKTSNESSLTDAMTVVNELNISYKKVDITGIVDSAVEATENEQLGNVRKGNIMARTRMILLYDRSAADKALVIGTSNKTEILLGYTTIFGDSASAINPIGDLYKTQLRDLAEHLNVPQNIIDKQPTADLWAGQTDEGELGFTYKEVDEYLFQKIDCRKSYEELKLIGFEEGFMKRVDSMVKRNQFRRLPPLIAKISNRTVNIDFRYNRDWNT
jgi:NAD+ synthase